MDGQVRFYRGRCYYLEEWSRYSTVFRCIIPVVFYAVRKGWPENGPQWPKHVVVSI